MSAPAIERVASRPRVQRRATKRSRFVGLLVVLMLLGVVAAVLLPVYAGWRVVSDGSVNDRRSSDAIVVLGAAQFDGRPSPVLASRLNHAQSLYDRSVAPRIITVGGKQRGDRFTEAGAGMDYLVRRGIPAADITAVPLGRDTEQSLIAVAQIAEREGWDEVTLVSDPAHMARVDAIANQLGFRTHLNPTRRGDGSSMNVRYVMREAAGWLLFNLVQRWDAPKPLR